MEKYEKVTKIGSGTFGIVHLVRRKSDGFYFALKKVPLDNDAPEDKRAINNEVRGEEKILNFMCACIDPSAEKFKPCKCCAVPR